MVVLAKTFALFGSLLAALAVMLGAFGAHGLKTKLTPEMLVTFETGVRYHFYHALGLFAVALIAALLPDSVPLRWAGYLMVAGIVLFSGSLYALSLTGVRGLGIITPFGGLAFIAAWLLLALAIASA
jgi:uncharacterized membrane protein YgdD (TMEM256/DUF423 family)